MGPAVGGLADGAGGLFTGKCGKSAQFELPGKFMKVSYNDSLSD